MKARDFFTGLLFAMVSPYAVYEVLRDNSVAANEKRKQEARNIIRNYKVEWRTRSGFLASGCQRELILRDKPLSESEIDEIMNTVDVNDILKTEIA